MKGIAAALLVATMLAPLAALPVAAEFPDRPAERLLPVVEVTPTDRFGGGQMVRVRVGDVSLAVIWSANESFEKGVRLLVDYVRFFGGAELYDEHGNYLQTMGLPVHTVLMQDFTRMIEFRDVDSDGLFDLRLDNRTDFPTDHPVKVLSLQTRWFLDGDLEQGVTNTSAWVNFTISAVNVPYARVYDPVAHEWRLGTREDGVLEKISLTFHLAATIGRDTFEIPFYRVRVGNGTEAAPIASTFLENRTTTAATIAVDGKYDTRIEGWDFGFEDSKLALATGLAFGNFYPRPIVRWLQEQFGGACLKDGSFEHCESDTGPTTPVRIARDRLQVAEGWYRTGEAHWVSHVLVDGVTHTMTFEIYWAEPFAINRGDRIYAGFRAFGAFVYPQGNTIVHDPGLGAKTFIAPLPETANVAPSIVAALQVAVVAVALIPALLLRRRARGGMMPPRLTRG